MTRAERLEELLGQAMLKAREQQMGKRWLQNKRQREAKAYEVYRLNKEGGRMGGHAKHRNMRGKPTVPHKTTIAVNKMMIDGVSNAEIADSLGIKVRTVYKIISRNELPDMDMYKDAS